MSDGIRSVRIIFEVYLSETILDWSITGGWVGGEVVYGSGKSGQ